MRDSWPTNNVEKSLDVSNADLVAWKDTCIGGENGENDDDPVAVDIKIPSMSVYARTTPC